MLHGPMKSFFRSEISFHSLQPFFDRTVPVLTYIGTCGTIPRSGRKDECIASSQVSRQIVLILSTSARANHLMRFALMGGNDSMPGLVRDLGSQTR